jgi:LysM repeat protein
VLAHPRPAVPMEAMASNTYDRRKGSRFVARIFALLALAAVSVIVVAVVSNTLGGSTEPAKKAKHAAPAPKPKPKADYYLVQPGDTFSGIAASQHVPLPKLARLNRGRALDPDVLQAGQCVDLVHDGCSKLGSGG